MTFLQVNFENEETTLLSFERIAKKISNDINLKINDAYYRIVDFEFYTFSSAVPDPHTYKNALQLELGKLYLHGSGIDITFGDGTNYGGILLRSIVRLHNGSGPNEGFMAQQFDGPQIVATELFSKVNSLLSDEKNIISLIDINGHNQDSGFYPARKTITTKRVGLTTKSSDLDDYYKNLPLRYIAVLPKFPNFKQTIKGIENILSEQVLLGNMLKEEATDILGYQKIF